MATITDIQFKRVKNETAPIKEMPVQYGEPVFFAKGPSSKGPVLGIGANSDTENTVGTLPVAKLVSRDIVDNSVYYKEQDKKIILTDDAGDVLNFTMEAEDIHVNDLTLPEALAQKEDRIPTTGLPVSKGGTGLTSIPSGEVMIGGSSGNVTTIKIAKSVPTSKPNPDQLISVNAVIDALSYKANSDSPILTGNATYTGVYTSDKEATKKIANTEFVQGAIDNKLSPVIDALSLKANSKSPALTGTATYSGEEYTGADEATTKIANTKFVQDAIGNRLDKLVVSKTPQTKDVKIYPVGVQSENAALEYSEKVYIWPKTGIIVGAAWNDFAEYRKCQAAPGTVVCETGKGDLVIASEHLQAAPAVISDTFGMVIGIQEEGYLPVAVAGRVLVLYSGDVSDYHAGDCVCADKFGRIAKMSREEIKEYPDRILGYVSEIPSYDEWNHVKVANRIWIKLK